MRDVEKKLSELNGTQDALYKKEVRRCIRLRYDLDDELALARQRQAKPEEWAEFDAYCEQCKAEAKATVFGE